MSAPNLLLIMTDQLRYDQIGYAAGACVDTPHLDRLAAAGVIFDTAYSSSTVCVPARTSLLTGLLHHRLPRESTEGSGHISLKQGFWTVAHALRSAGYETAAIGKMHMFPMYSSHGFDVMRLCEHLNAGYNVGDVDDYGRWLVEKGLEDYRVRLFDGARRIKLRSVGCPYEAPFHPTSWVTQEAISWIESRDRTRPYFAIVSYPPRTRHSIHPSRMLPWSTRQPFACPLMGWR